MNVIRCLSLLIVAAAWAGPAQAGNESAPTASRQPNASVQSLGQYVVLGWNDLGMHCMNKDYAYFCILPPYNVMHAQVIRRGNPPQVVESAVDLTYRFPNNTSSAGKINFWDNVKGLFGVTLAPNIGLTGLGLSGAMSWNSTLGVYEALGVPLTPYEDSAPTVEQPYQFAEVTVKSTADHSLLDQTTFVAPVAVEMHCNKCHGGDGGPSTAQAIMNVHAEETGQNLLNIKPVLCASCHSSNALGTAGRPGLPSLSLALHGAHADADTVPECYDCHPGQNTRCLRDAMFSAGKKCQDCHGTLAQVAQSIRNGRRPWLDEPSCSNLGCHDANHGPEAGKLYRHSKGHGGLACEACHNSPHAVLPTVEPRDSVQVQRVQGTASYIKDCQVCHTTEPLEAGPHGVLTGWRIANHLTGKAPLPAGDVPRADINKDGQLDVSDVVFQVNRGL